MTPHEQNELLTRSGPGTAHGKLAAALLDSGAARR